MEFSSDFQNCVQNLITKTSGDQSKELFSRSVFDHTDDYWKSEMRVEAIRKGLEYIYLLSKNGEVFNTFGNDIIQCFYDLSKVELSTRFHIGLSRTNTSFNLGVSKCCENEMAINSPKWVLEREGDSKRTRNNGCSDHFI